MALGLAKSVIVKFSQSGAQAVKGDLKDVAAGAKEVGDKAATAGLKIKALQIELAALKRTGGDLADIRRRIAEIGDTATSTSAKLSALRLALGAAGSDQGGGGGGGLFGGLGRLLGLGGGGDGGGGGGAMGLAKLGATPGPFGIPLAAYAIPSPALLLSGIGGIIPLLAAAGMGVAAFGALAIPTFSKVSTAITAIGAATTKAQLAKAWDAVPKSLVPVVKGVLSIQSVWDKMAASLTPLIAKIMTVGVSIAGKILPALLPLARAGGGAILTLLQGFDKFASSPGFRAFMTEMTKLAGPAIVTLGEGIGKITVAIGKLLLALVNPAALKILRESLRDIAVLITGLAWVITKATPQVRTFFAEAVSEAKTVGSSFAQLGIDLNQWFAIDLPHWISIGVDWFRSLAGKVKDAVADLPGVLRVIGENAISALIGGLKSVPVLGTIIGIGQTVIGGFKSILGIHSPSTVFTQIGFFIGEGLIDGLLSTGSRAANAASQIAAIFTARFQAIAAYARQVMQGAIQFAGIAGAATGPAYGTYSPGRAAYTSFTALGAPVFHPAVAASGTPPPTAAGIIRNLGSDVARLRAFSGIIKRLSQLGLGRFVIEQIVAAGPDQGYQIAEALLDAGRGAIRQVNAEQNAIFRYAGQLGLNAAAAQFGGPGGNYHVTFNIQAGLNNPQQIAQEIRRLLLMLKRQHGGQGLGFG